MTILILERATASLRGELSRWMLEPKAGIFVGKLSGLVRDKLWDKVCGSKGVGAAILVQASQCEQGFTMRLHGDTTRVSSNWEGVELITRREAPGAIAVKP